MDLFSLMCLMQTVYLPIMLATWWGKVQERKRIERALIFLLKLQTRREAFKRGR